jgi:hypothetical protein
MHSWIEAIKENKDKELGALAQGAKKVNSKYLHLLLFISVYFVN